MTYESDGPCAKPCKAAGFDVHPLTRSGLTCGRTSLAVANGDHFTADAYLDSQPLATLDVLVDYDETWPNGKDCDDVPCRSKSLEMTLVK